MLKDIKYTGQCIGCNGAGVKSIAEALLIILAIHIVANINISFSLTTYNNTKVLTIDMEDRYPSARPECNIRNNLYFCRGIGLWRWRLPYKEVEMIVTYYPVIYVALYRELLLIPVLTSYSYDRDILSFDIHIIKYPNMVYINNINLFSIGIKYPYYFSENGSYVVDYSIFSVEDKILFISYGYDLINVSTRQTNLSNSYIVVIDPLSLSIEKIIQRKGLLYLAYYNGSYYAIEERMYGSRGRIVYLTIYSDPFLENITYNSTLFILDNPDIFMVRMFIRENIYFILSYYYNLSEFIVSINPIDNHVNWISRIDYKEELMIFLPSMRESVYEVEDKVVILFSSRITILDKENGHILYEICNYPFSSLHYVFVDPEIHKIIFIYSRSSKNILNATIIDVERLNVNSYIIDLPNNYYLGSNYYPLLTNSKHVSVNGTFEIMTPSFLLTQGKLALSTTYIIGKYDRGDYKLELHDQVILYFDDNDLPNATIYIRFTQPIVNGNPDDISHNIFIVTYFLDNTTYRLLILKHIPYNPLPVGEYPIISIFLSYSLIIAILYNITRGRNSEKE